MAGWGRSAAFILCALLVATASWAQGNPRFGSDADQRAIQSEMAARGMASVLVDLKPDASSGPQDEVAAASAAVARVNGIVARLGIGRIRRVLPVSSSFSAEVNQEELDRLLQDDAIQRIEHDGRVGIQQGYPTVPAPVIGRSLLQVGSSFAYEAYGGGGNGTITAILDSGVDADHPALAGRIVDEQCFSTPDAMHDSTCREGRSEDSGIGAARPCVQKPGCNHGTGTASVVIGFQALPLWAGPVAGARVRVLGTAPQGLILPIQVMSLPRDGGALSALRSDLRAALQFVHQRRNAYPGRAFAAINMSLNAADDLYSGPCDSGGLADDIRALRAAGIATVISAGNQGDKTKVAWPACISEAITVAAVNPYDTPASFSNFSQSVDFFAPGEAIDVAVPGGGIEPGTGTSFAAPHIAGAIGALREWIGQGASLDDLSRSLRDSGKPVMVGTLERKRLDLAAAFPSSRPRMIILNSPDTVTLCDSCTKEEVILRVTSGTADWSLVEAPPWLDISGKSGQAPQSITIFRGAGFDGVARGTIGHIVLRNQSVAQPDLVLRVRKGSPAAPDLNPFRIERIENNAQKLPFASTISSDVVISANGTVTVMAEEMPPPIPSQFFNFNERRLIGPVGEQWRFDGMPPWLRAVPAQGQFRVLPNGEAIAFTHSQLDVEVAKLEPGREHRVPFSIIRNNDASDRINMMAVIHVSKPAGSDLLSVSPTSGVRFQGRRGGLLTSIDPRVLIRHVAGAPTWEIYELPTWLSASAMRGTANATITFSLTPAAAELPVGQYSTYVVIRNRSGYQRPIALSVSLVISRDRP